MACVLCENQIHRSFCSRGRTDWKGRMLLDKACMETLLSQVICFLCLPTLTYSRFPICFISALIPMPFTTFRTYAVRPECWWHYIVRGAGYWGCVTEQHFSELNFSPLHPAPQFLVQERHRPIRTAPEKGHRDHQWVVQPGEGNGLEGHSCALWKHWGHIRKIEKYFTRISRDRTRGDGFDLKVAVIILGTGSHSHCVHMWKRKFTIKIQAC